MYVCIYIYIYFIHSLVQWLKYSKKEFCELCKHKFTFKPSMLLNVYIINFTLSLCNIFFIKILFNYDFLLNKINLLAFSEHFLSNIN